MSHDDLTELDDEALIHLLGRIRRELQRRGDADPGRYGEFEYLYHHLADDLENVVMKYEMVVLSASGDATLDEMLHAIDDLHRNTTDEDDDE